MKRKRNSRLKASSSLTVREILEDQMTQMNVGTISDEDKEAIIQEVESKPEMVTVGPSFASIVVGDVLTFIIFSTALYMLIIYLMNSMTESLLL